MIYKTLNLPILDFIPKKTKRVLDIGCGTGVMGKAIKKHIPCEVWGITNSQEEAIIAGGNIDQVIVQDLNNFNNPSLGKFDLIICSHVLEHLFSPEKLLKNLYQYMEPETVLIVALPNIMHWKQRLIFLKGRFKYEKDGLCDKTHFRFFDWLSAQELFTKNTYVIEKIKVCGNMPLPCLRKILPLKICYYLDNLATSVFPNLFGKQFIFVVKKGCK